MSKQPDQATDEIREDHLFNLLVNVLTGAFSLEIGENAEIVVKQNSYLDEQDQRVLGSLDVNLKSPDVDCG